MSLNTGLPSLIVLAMHYCVLQHDTVTVDERDELGAMAKILTYIAITISFVMLSLK